jgi:hypothetical protein
MKKNSVFLICAILLSACSLNVDQFLGIPPTPIIAPTFTVTITNTPADMPTITPTVPTPTFTLTPTLIGQKTKTFTPEFTATELFVTLPPSATPFPLDTQVPIPGFANVTVSDEAFYKGKACLPVSVKITAQVADPGKVAFVVLFVRFKSKLTGTTSKWTSIPMEKQTKVAGTFTHDLVPSEMKAADYFENAWVQYQIVSTDINSKQVGKTDIFSKRLTLLECDPEAMPTTTITPTVPAP